MSLENELSLARKEIVSDGYDMSVGEIMNLYKDHEIVINPEFQRLFRWDITRKTRFIESLLLGIPIPPIFVYQNDDGIWELIDGLQRLSTVLEFSGILRNADGQLAAPSVLEGTRFLPGLTGKRWASQHEEKEEEIGHMQQIQIKRARMRVEILKQESDSTAKYELFQRLNTGGAGLSEQEVRNCIAVMVNPQLFAWMKKCSNMTSFLTTIDQTEYALEKQMALELVLRFFAFRNVPYKSGLDVHEYLDEALMSIAVDKDFDQGTEESNFEQTFNLIESSLNSQAFKRWDGSEFKGKFLMSVFEVIATGISKNLEKISGMDRPTEYITQRCKDLWDNETFKNNSGAGVRGTTRLTNLLPMAKTYFSV